MEALLSNSLESPATIFLSDLWKPEHNIVEPDAHYLLLAESHKVTESRPPLLLTLLTSAPLSTT